MLYQITLTNPLFFHIRQQPLYHIQLMVSRKHLRICFLLGIRVFLFHHLGVVFNNAGQFLLGQNVLPEIVGHYAVWVGWIPRSIFVALVERKKPAGFSIQLGTELDLRIVHRKMNHAVFELKQQFFGITVMLVLINGIIHILLGKLVFQLKCNDRKTINEHAQVQRQPCGVLGIHQLAGYTKDILLEHLTSSYIFGGGGQIEHD